jgi:hypothetical protein
VLAVLVLPGGGVSVLVSGTTSVSNVNVTIVDVVTSNNGRERAW